MTWTKEMICAAATLLLCGTLSTSAAQTTKTKNTQAAVPAPQDYCTSTGGVWKVAILSYGTKQSHPGLDSTPGTRRLSASTRRPRTAPAFTVSLATLFTNQAQSGRAGVLRGNSVERPGERQSRIVLLHATRRLRFIWRSQRCLAAAGWNSIPSNVVLEACIFSR